ncbi:MAG: type II toxin-antitoxin system VapC family toxin [Nanoarchaeota archaeon]|nr:type II toxin-antitoxin system VapC family toxin [Nanoarchaeota archaeon]
MQRIMLDTSVYGELVKEQDAVEFLKKTPEFAIYGCKTIRAELRAVPKKVLIGNRHLRPYLLTLYDSLVSKEERTFQITKLIETIAKEYHREYKALGGGYSQKDMQNDFLIIASASLHNMDIVVSCDIKSMLGEKAVIACRNTNKKFQLRNPSFKPYKAFMAEIKHLCKSSGGRSH